RKEDRDERRREPSERRRGPVSRDTRAKWTTFNERPRVAVRVSLPRNRTLVASPDVTRLPPNGPPLDARTEVTLTDYLENRRDLPGLFEFAPERADADQWVTVVRAQADPLADVRLLLADGEAYL